MDNCLLKPDQPHYSSSFIILLIHPKCSSQYILYEYMLSAVPVIIFVYIFSKEGRCVIKVLLLTNVKSQDDCTLAANPDQELK